MDKTRITTSIPEQERTITTYYQFQSRIYDLTRWAFLFGRRQIVSALPFSATDAFTLLEVGCGTGYNLRQLARTYPNAKIYGMDLSADMLTIARQQTSQFEERVALHQVPYGKAAIPEQPDAILFSYALTMINPQWNELLDRAYQDLPEGGVIAVTDFHNSRFGWFKRHMGNHHVRMDGHLLPQLTTQFNPLIAEVKPAYAGLWNYLVFIGQKD